MENVTVQLKVRTEDGYQVKKHEIEKLQFFQFNRTFSLVADILEEVEKNEGVKDMIFDVFFGGADGFDAQDLEGLSEEEIAMLKEKADADVEKKFVKALFNSFDILLVHIPEKMAELLAVTADIERSVLDRQEMEVVFDVFDALMEVNNIESLVVRGKQSLGISKKMLSFMKKDKKAEKTK